VLRRPIEITAFIRSWHPPEQPLAFATSFGRLAATEGNVAKVDCDSRARCKKDFMTEEFLP